MSNAVVTLKKGEGRTIKSGGMWIYDNEIDTMMGTYENGDIVLVHDFDGYPMGRGFINENCDFRGSRLAAGTGDRQVFGCAGGAVTGAGH